MNIENNIIKILNKSNKDHDLEYFWLIFKDTVIKYVSPEMLIKINTASEHFNVFQSQKMYEKISKGINEFIENNINDISITAYFSNNYTYLDRLRTHVQRWKKLYDDFIIPIITEIIIIYVDYSRKKNHNCSQLHTFLNIFLLQSVNHQEFIYSDNFIELLKISINYKFPALFDLIRSKRDINQFICVKGNISFKTLENTKTHKLLDMIYIE